MGDILSEKTLQDAANYLFKLSKEEPMNASDAYNLTKETELAGINKFRSDTLEQIKACANHGVYVLNLNNLLNESDTRFFESLGYVVKTIESPMVTTNGSKHEHNSYTQLSWDKPTLHKYTLHK